MVRVIVRDRLYWQKLRSLSEKVKEDMVRDGLKADSSIGWKGEDVVYTSIVVMFKGNTICEVLRTIDKDRRMFFEFLDYDTYNLYDEEKIDCYYLKDVYDIVREDSTIRRFAIKAAKDYCKDRNI